MPEKFPTTGSGKGDKSRVQNPKAYRENIENINWKSDKKTSKKKKK